MKTLKKFVFHKLLLITICYLHMQIIVWFYQYFY